MRSRYLGHWIALATAGAAVLAPSAAWAQAPVKAAQLIDLAPNHWAYGAIQSLVDKYRVMGGYPDMTFRGQKAVSRYELAAVLAQVMNRFDSLEGKGIPATPSDAKMVERLKDEFRVELLDLHKRLVSVEQKTTALESAVRDLKNNAGGSGKVSGNVGVTIQDDPQDRLLPYAVTSFEVAFGGEIDETTSYKASIGGGNAAGSSGGTPLFTRRNKTQQGLPSGAIELNGNVAISSKHPKLGISTFRVGQFAPGAMMGLGGFAHHYGDGIIGSGLSGPSGNTVRTWDNSEIGIGAKSKFGSLGVGGGINTKFMYAGLSYDLGSFGDVRVIGDMDHNSIGDVTLTGDPVYSGAAALNLGSDKLGLSIQGGLTYAGVKFTPKFGVNGIITSFLDSEICAGFTYKTDPDGTAMEIIPTAYIFVPSEGWRPSVLFGAKEPQTLATKGGGSGPGSVLGTKAGWTLQFGIPNPFLPSFTFEMNMQSNLLAGDYDGFGYAITTSTDF
ncbi:S-layer homology domain-containing protein [bacterium]|nr:S-layer homology domain-containing protein [bacterium]